MAVELEIRDGNPWWLSPDIWTVPGEDPEGPAGTPLAGGPTYLWASVRNNGSAPVQNATVRFYWANPAVGFDRTTANLVGTAFVSLSPGEVRDVLCLTPWQTEFVNGGHECVLAEAFHPSDPLSAAPAFDVPTDRHVAQRNLNVVTTSKKKFVVPFEVHNTSREALAFTIVAETGSIQDLRRSANASDKAVLVQAGDGKVVRLALSTQRCPKGEEMREPRARIEGVKLAPRGRTGFTLVGEIEGNSAVVHVRQFVDGKREVGGLSVLVLDR